MKIQLYNRYNNNIWLEKISDNMYELNGDVAYCRIIYEDNEMTIIKAVDPDGGPFMMVDNFEIEGNKVKEIVDLNNKFRFYI